jgi:hypothetical protein
MFSRTGLLLAGVVSALLIAGGAAAGTHPPKIDLSSMSAIDTLLRAKGIDPATVVKQVGLNNYAGPQCPGPGWNCTTATKVVQISTEGPDQGHKGDNRFVCNPVSDQLSATDAATNMCFIMQGGQNNHATCNESASTDVGAAMTCDITQAGEHNTAEINQHANQTVGPLQDAEQTANVDQDATEKNIVQIHQDVVQKTSSALPEDQEAYQQANVIQHVNGSQNYAHVHQSQDQHEAGASELQKQNVMPNPSFNCGDEKPGAPNQCVNVFQDATPGGGSNVDHLHQQVGEQQTSSAFAPDQTQGSAQGGQEGNVHQENPAGVGENLNFPNQDLRQRQSSPTGTAHQVQVTDPGCCGVGTQVGGAKTVEDIDQSTTQSADEPLASQLSELFGRSHQVTGDDIGPYAATTTSSQNQCSITQHGRNNGGGETFSASGNSQPECVALMLTTICVYPSEGASCAPPVVCTECCTICLTGPLPATAGQDIAMPDYTSEPSTYFPPTP